MATIRGQLLLEAGIYLFADINDGWIIYVRMSDTVTTVKCFQEHNLAMLSELSFATYMLAGKAKQR